MAGLGLAQRPGGRRNFDGGRRAATAFWRPTTCGPPNSAPNWHRRSRLAESQGRGAPLLWARSPQQTALGVPVDWLTGFRRIRRAEALQQPDLVQQTGRFAVACGLALTGLKQAALPLNLLAAEQRGVLSRVSQLVRLRSERSAWGIDFGPSGLKAVKLVWDESQQQAVIEAAALIEHAKSLSQAANEAEERRLVGETLKAFLDSHDTKSAQVCVGMPGRLALSRPLELPPIEPAKVAKFVEFEARCQFPFPLEQLSWDFQFFQGPPAASNGAAADKEGRQALLIGAKRTATQRFLEILQRSGLRVDALQTDFIGLHNLLVDEHFGAEGNSAAAAAPAAVAAVDVGCDVTNVVVSSPHALWHHTCGVAGQTFSRSLVKEFNLSLAQAEQRKRAPESLGRLSDLFDVLGPVFEELLKETREALAGYAQAHPGRPLRQVLGLGGGCSLHGLLRYPALRPLRPGDSSWYVVHEVPAGCWGDSCTVASGVAVQLPPQRWTRHRQQLDGRRTSRRTNPGQAWSEGRSAILSVANVILRRSDCHPERSEGSRPLSGRFFAALRMTPNGRPDFSDKA